MISPKNIWQHRISHEAEIAHPLLEKGYLSIGFADFTDTNIIEVTRATDGNAWENFEKIVHNIWGRKPRNRHDLWRFVAEMNPGDWVIVPSWGCFLPYRIKSIAIPITQVQIENLSNWHKVPVQMTNRGITRGEQPGYYDIGFLIEVELIDCELPKISRVDYADAALSSRLKYRGTTISCNNITESVITAITSAKEKRPINLHSQILDASQDLIWKLICEQLVPDKLETLIQWYFQQMGASSVEIPAKNESGKEGDGDIVATFPQLRTVYYVQAKHHKLDSYTNEWAIEQIANYTEHKNNISDDDYTRVSWVITTAECYTDEAIKRAANLNVQLINGADLARLLLETGISGLDKIFS